MGEQKPNYEMLLKSAIRDYILAYGEWKNLYKAFLDCTYVDHEGNFCVLKNDYYKHLSKAEKQYKYAAVRVSFYKAKIGIEKKKEKENKLDI